MRQFLAAPVRHVNLNCQPPTQKHGIKRKRVQDRTCDGVKPDILKTEWTRGTSAFSSIST
ncbi:hypothetical protein EYF80_021204 [Liparis tanakae]|uniref:Uncharacterized protein n=1 Tax=Liparis tanakae TaxID=230148 RepID=A0A4Z2HS26_9TELE|nr:hypothetical protein EYF80_021204 [Liparis tanakae]